MSETLILVIIVVGVALIFDFFNGFHDAANAIATLVMAKTLTPTQAVLLAGMANFAGFLFGVAVAKTIGKGIIDTETLITSGLMLKVLLAALSGAVVWNIATWLLGLPTSSSHALIGGLIGAGFAAKGVGIIVFSGVLKILSFIIIAPLLGMVGAMIFTTSIMWIFRKSNPANAQKTFKKMQLFSSAVNAIGHGSNDAQKSMGIIAIALVAGGMTANLDHALEQNHWVVFSCYAAISLGTMFGGWRIVKTMGSGITKIRAMEGVCADSASAITLLFTAHAGIPVSTTHVIAGSIMGVGATKNAAAVRWVTARKILWAWILTIPFTAMCAALCYGIISIFI